MDITKMQGLVSDLAAVKNEMPFSKDEKGYINFDTTRVEHADDKIVDDLNKAVKPIFDSYRDSLKAAIKKEADG